MMLLSASILLGAAVASKTDGHTTFLRDHSESRRLDSTDLVNSFLEGQSFTIASDDIDATFDNIIVNGEIFLSTASVVQSGEEKMMRVQIGIDNFAANCDMNEPINLGNVRFQNSDVAFSFDIFSTEFGEVIPSRAVRTSNSAFSCPDDMISLDTTSGAADLLIALGISSMCSPLREVVDTIAEFVANNPLTNVIGDRIEQVESIALVAEDGELASVANIPDGYDFLSAASFEEVFESYLSQLALSPFGQDMQEQITVLVSAVEAEDFDTAESALEKIIFLLTEMEIDLDLSGLLGEEDRRRLFDIDLSDLDLKAEIFTVLAGILPSPAEFDEFIDSLPDQVEMILRSLGIVDLISDFLEEIQASISDNSRRLLDIPSLDVLASLTIGDLIALFPEANAITEFLSEFGNETLVLDVLTSFLENFTVADVIAFIPEDVSVEEILSILSIIGINEDSTISDVLATVTSFLLGQLEGLGESFGSIDFDINNEISSDLIAVLSLIPGLEDIVATLSNGGTWADILAENPFLIELGSGISLTLTVTALSVTAAMDLITNSVGKVGEATFIFPGINISQADVGLGFSFELAQDGTITLADELSFALNLAFNTQEAITFIFDNSDLMKFDFEDLETLPQLSAIISGMASCGFGNVGVAVTSQKTHGDTSISVNSVDAFSGFFEDFLNLFSLMYAPAIPTYIETALFNLTQDAEFFFSSDLLESCENSAKSLSSVSDNEGDSGVFGSLDETVGYALIGAAALAVGVVAAAFIIGRNKRVSAPNKPGKEMLKQLPADTPADEKKYVESMI